MASGKPHQVIAATAGEGLDAVLVNDIQGGRGFGAQANTLTPATAQGPQAAIGPLPKEELARAVVQWWGRRLEA